MQLIDLSPFEAANVCLVDESGAETLVVVVKGTYACGDDGQLMIADEQLPPVLADEYYGEPNTSSLQFATDISLRKPGTDVALRGHAWARDAETIQLDVSFIVGSLEKKVRVFGDRCWTKRSGSFAISAPEPFDKIPLVYERAFGGVDESCRPAPQFEPRNPVGTGFFGKKSGVPIPGTKLPNLEDPADLISHPHSCPAPAGFGFVAPSWEPRARLAGTYDEKWRKSRMPLVPNDFDARFFCAASKGLTSEGFLAGDELVRVTNVCQQGDWEFRLPGHQMEAVVDLPERYEILPLVLDTLVVDADDRRILLTWRGQMNIHGIVFQIGWIKTQLAGATT